MNTYSEHFRATALATTMLVSSVFGITSAVGQENSVKLLTANFEPRQVVQVEVGDFHFKPGQVAPVHTHDAPAVGYVAKGQIIYQVEGEKPQILREGDAFYEPTDTRILRFDNASATEEAIFLDFNLEQVDEPFIVFEHPPTEHIDRRSLPTINLDGQSVDQVDIYSTELSKSGTFSIANAEPTVGLIAEGVVELQIAGEATQRIIAGGSFALPIANVAATVVNTSSEVTAKIITFRLR